MAINLVEGEVSWKRRLAIVLSILWLAAFGALGAEERHGGFVIFLVFGLFPVVSLWGIWWVWSAYRRQKTPSQTMGNMFEGARRIAKLIAVFIVVGFSIAIVFDRPSTAKVFFTITGPGQPPVSNGCFEVTRSAFKTTRHGDLVELTLCFEEREFVAAQQGKNFDPYDKAPFDPDAYLASDQKRRFVDPDDLVKLVPYHVDKVTGVVWGKTKSSPEVTKYMSNVLDTFQIPEAEEDRINNLWWSNKLELMGSYFLGMLASLAGLWAFTWTVGWIVRGFMGIPRGADSR